MASNNFQANSQFFDKFKNSLFHAKNVSICCYKIIKFFFIFSQISPIIFELSNMKMNNIWNLHRENSM